MAKQIRFTYEDKDYVLEYTRRSVQEMEREGFIASDVASKPMTVVPQLFAGAFKANHKFVKPEKIEEIYKLFPDKEKLFERLAEMYQEPISALIEEPSEEAKKIDWVTNW